MLAIISWAFWAVTESDGRSSDTLVHNDTVILDDITTITIMMSKMIDIHNPDGLHIHIAPLSSDMCVCVQCKDIVRCFFAHRRFTSRWCVKIPKRL